MLFNAFSFVFLTLYNGKMVKCRKFKGVRGFLDKVIKYDVSSLAPYIGQAGYTFFFLSSSASNIFQ